MLQKHSWPSKVARVVPVDFEEGYGISVCLPNLHVYGLMSAQLCLASVTRFVPSYYNYVTNQVHNSTSWV